MVEEIQRRDRTWPCANDLHVRRRAPRKPGGRPPAATRGAALSATLLVVALILALAGTGLLLARAALVLFMNFRDATATLYLARAGIERALAVLRAGYSFDALLAGPDGIRGSADDGDPGAGAAVSGCTVRAEDDAGDPDPDRLADGNGRIRVVSEGAGPRGARSRIEALVGRAPAPYVPAAAYLGRPDLDVAATATFDGADHAPGDPPGAASGPGPPVAAAATPVADVPVALPGGVQDAGGAAVTAAPAAAIDAEDFAVRLVSAGPPAGPLPLGTFGPAALRVVGDATLAAPAVGAGVLIVEGSLDVNVPVEVRGAVIVLGRLRVAAEGTLSVRGWLWVEGRGAGPAVTADGPLSVIYSSEAVAEADRLFRLPRRPVVLSEREAP
jgi:hypothetical protein